MKGSENIEQQLDSLFKDTLNNAQIPAPEGIWENVAQSISSPAPSIPHTELASNTGTHFLSGISTIGKIAILATTAAITGTGIYFLTKTDNKSDSPISLSAITEQNTSKIQTPEHSDTKQNIEQTLSDNPADKYTRQNIQTEKPNNHIFNQSDKTDHVTSNTPLKSDNPDNGTTSNPANTTGNPIESLNKAVPTQEDKLYNLLSDTIICLSSDLKDIQLFDKIGLSNIRFFDGDRPIKTAPFSIKNKWVTARTNTQSGDKLERRFRIGSTTPSLEITNNGKDAVFCSILNGSELHNTDWFINNELINEDVNQIVYYRNMEFGYGTRIKLTLKTTDRNGCPASYSEDITSYFNNSKEFMIPTVITPNNDGLNDKWIIDIQNAVYFNVKVLGPENSIIFQTNDVTQYWDGNDMQGNAVNAGAYIYILNYQQQNEKAETKTGIIQVIRN
ncbi:MAG: gliding motility-associated C-terminal domain-containing protein [Bacteroidia bacterium]|nr:gliding motility-associated C-terminal domain-containing protein [Bacteroidia bacterium]MCO5253765.1 gliding motility-associated C-terminal domain-containing protein [Bacteroidota bacterium]MCZ2130817.1 gliding motility-associated C-terminal domain-containing protein [Bacteroidia bacterium]